METKKKLEMWCGTILEVIYEVKLLEIPPAIRNFSVIVLASNG